MSNTNDYLLPEHSRPEWLIYPAELINLIRSGRVSLNPWILDKAHAVNRTSNRLKTRLGRELVPFAYRQDREDLACFEKGKGEVIVIIHDNTDPGWEDEGNYPNFAAWLRAAEVESESWGRQG